jgi:hypothetical protein
MINDSNNSLKKLAVKLFSITPHSVACERSFSMLGFLYGKRRQNLNLNTIEMMAKIRHYLFSNSQKELNHPSEKEEIELKTLIEECGLFNDEDYNENDEDDKVDENFFDNNGESFEIPTHEVQVLIINNIVDMNDPIFSDESTEEIQNHNSSDDDDDDEVLDEELDFETITGISAPSNMH